MAFGAVGAAAFLHFMASMAFGAAGVADFFAFLLIKEHSWTTRYRTWHGIKSLSTSTEIHHMNKLVEHIFENNNTTQH